MSNLRDFFLQLETSLTAGVSLARTLQLLSENVSGLGMKGKVARMAKDIEKGCSFSEALEKAGGPFNQMHVHFIRFGEQTGTLPNVCGTLAEYADREMNLQSELLSSLAYPLFLLLVALVMVPVLQTIVAQGPAGSLVTGILKYLGLYLIIIAAIYGTYRVLATSAAASILIHVPFFGTIFQKLSLCRFTRSLSVGLSAGVQMNQCLETSISVTANPWLEKELNNLKAVIRRGGSLIEGLKTVNSLPSTMKEMIAVGEQSGKLPEMLKKTSDYFEEDARQRIKVISKLLPIVFFLPIAIVVGYIIISMGSNIFAGLQNVK